MSKFDKAYGKQHLTALDLPKNKTVKLVIKSAVWQPFQDFKTSKDINKIVLDFEGDWKPLIMSGSVARPCARAWGEDLKTWAQRVLPLYRTRIEVKGEMIEVIRCDEDVIENDEDIAAMNSPRNERQQHPGEKLYAGGKTDTERDSGSIEDLPNEDGWEKDE
jgi:hypothetical protein